MALSLVDMVSMAMVPIRIASQDMGRFSAPTLGGTQQAGPRRSIGDKLKDKSRSRGGEGSCVELAIQIRARLRALADVTDSDITRIASEGRMARHAVDLAEHARARSATGEMAKTAS